MLHAALLEKGSWQRGYRGVGTKAVGTWGGQDRAALGGEASPHQLPHKQVHPQAPWRAQPPLQLLAVLPELLFFLPGTQNHPTFASAMLMEKEAPFLQETQLLRAPAANPLLPLPSVVPQLHWGGFYLFPRAGEEGAVVPRGLLWAVPEGSTYPHAVTCPHLPGLCVGLQGRTPGVLWPTSPAGTAQEGPRQGHVAQQGGVWVQQALTPLLGEKGRVIQEGKNEEEPMAPWEISCAALPQMWWHWLSPVLALAQPDVAVPVPEPLWRGAGEGLLSALPFLCAPEKNTPSLLKGKLLCCVPRFSGCLQCLFNIILL